VFSTNGDFFNQLVFSVFLANSNKFEAGDVVLEKKCKLHFAKIFVKNNLIFQKVAPKSVWIGEKVAPKSGK